MWKWFKEKFLSYAFLAFVIIGVINTAIDYVVHWGTLIACDKVFFASYDITNVQTGFPYHFSVFLAKGLAFTLASIFSYFANAKFTYKVKEKSTKQFGFVFLTYLFRFAVTYLLDLAFIRLFKVMVSEEIYAKYWNQIPNLAASILLIPVFYIVLGIVYKLTDKRSKKEDENTENNA